MEQMHEIREALKALETGIYYSEDFELDALVRGFVSQLPLEAHGTLSTLIRERLQSESDILYVLFCVYHEVPDVEPELRRVLSLETADWKLLKAAMRALCNCECTDNGFRAIARYMDSGLAADALLALCELNFSRALPHLTNALVRPELAATCMQALYERRKAAGLETLTREIRDRAQIDDRLGPRLDALANSDLHYAPLSPPDLRCIVLAAQMPS